MVDKRISALPVALPATSSDLIPTSQGSSGVDTGVTRKMTFAGMAQGVGVGVNVRAYGATGNGVTDDTAAMLQAMAVLKAQGGGDYLIPKGRYLMSGTIYVPSNVTVKGAGRGATVLLGSSSWQVTPPSQYAFFENENYDAGSIIDMNITIQDLTIDYYQFGTAPLGGGKHAIRMWFAQYVTISNVEFKLATTGFHAEDATAFRAVHDGLIVGCFAYEAVNCSYDHWEECQRCAVVNCYAESAQVAQMVNFNPERTGGPNTNRTARGFILSGCHFKSTEATPAPIILAPLGNPVGSVRVVADVVVSNNVFDNCYLVIRGTVKGASVTANVFYNVAAPNSAIEAYEYAGQPDPSSGIVVVGNTIVNPNTDVANVGVIRMESAGAVIAGNSITGTSYGSVPGIACAQFETVLGINYTENGVISAPKGILNSASTRIKNGSSFGFHDTLGSISFITLQSDNNLLFNGTSSSGAARTFMAIQQRSSVSELILPLATQFATSFRSLPSAGLTATGTNIGGALTLTSNWNVVTTCVAGVADGVALLPVNGLEQTVINTTTAVLKVYPNNSGFAQIDGRGVGVPARIAPGKSKAFVQTVINAFSTVGEVGGTTLGVVAATGVTQGTALQIVAGYVDVTATGGATGILLPIAYQGLKAVVSGNAGNGVAVQLYPSSGQEIYIMGSGGLGVNTPQAISAFEAFVLECTVSGVWYGYQIS